MSTHKHIDKICCVAVVISLLLTILLMNGEAIGIQAADRVMGYENRLFDTSRVHTIDIVMDDWDSFIATCENEEYSACSVVIDGEAFKSVGIRAKGNTSLSTVSSMNSDRYSFKIEFDQYDRAMSYYGLDKLSLNNIIQDATYMKDYLTYQMMGEFGVDAPLCSYVYITVNGEDWGLYLAVEAIEDAFLQRNYGSDYGELYKPDSMSFGGGRGNGKDFNMDDFDFSGLETSDETSNGDFSQEAGRNQQMPGGVDPSGMFGQERGDGTTQMPPEENMQEFAPASVFGGGRGGGGEDMFGGMGSSDVKLQYSDDDPDSYSNIFNNAKTDITQADQTRLIGSLKALSAGENIGDVVDVDEVIRYFVVHNFVVNGDSYTGSMIHNYYLYEEDGQLSMIPWDYNLAYGTFQGFSAADAVNDPIDTPLSVTGGGDRPIIDWIFASAEYTELYHQYFAEFLDSVDFAQLIDTTGELIEPYVEKDPTKFYSYEEFEAGVEALKEFCQLRAQSVRGQLDGSIPSTSSGQEEDSSARIDASHLILSDMGSMGGGMGGGGVPGGNRADMTFDRGDMQTEQESTDSDRPTGKMTMPRGMELPEGMELPQGMQQNMPGGAMAGQMPQRPGNPGT